MKPTGIELLDILSACRKLGVNKIRTKEFDVEFFLESEKFEEVQSRPKPIDKGILDDVRLSQLMIDDPFGFEKEILNAEERGAQHGTFEN